MEQLSNKFQILKNPWVKSLIAFLVFLMIFCFGVLFGERHLGYNYGCSFRENRGSMMRGFDSRTFPAFSQRVQNQQDLTSQTVNDINQNQPATNQNQVPQNTKAN